MKDKLQNFNLLCQQIEKSLVSQKTHGLLHKLRPFARAKTYLQQDFMNLWNDSCFDKFKYALQSTKLDFNYSQIKVPNGERDIYEGTDRPGVILKYKVNPKDQKYLIQQLLQRLRNNASSDDLASWRGYILDDLRYCQTHKLEFHLPMELHIISRVVAKEGQSFQNKKSAQTAQFNFAGFDGNIYVWFDLQKYKDELKSVIDKQRQDAKRNLGQTINEQTQVVQQNNSSDEQDVNLHLTPKEYDKILIGQFKIRVKDSDKTGITGTVGKILNGGVEDLFATSLARGFDRLRGLGKYKDSSEKPDIIRKNITLFGVSKPYVEVVSTVTLKDWLYNVSEMPERKYLGKEINKINVSSLTKYPFVKENLKQSGDPTRTLDIDQNKCWSIGDLGGNARWDRQPITKKWLQDTNIKHDISLRIQSWIKKDGRYYFEYRFVFRLSGFYNLKNEINRLQIQIDQEENRVKRSQSKIDKLTEQLNKKKIYESSFDKWFQDYINQMSKYRPNEDVRASADKLLYDNRGQLVGKDVHIGSSLQQLNSRDVNAYNFLRESVLGQLKNWKCQGESFNEILSNL